MTESRWNEGRSIHIGIDRVDDAIYRGWLGELQSGEADAKAMRGLADSMGFASRLLVGDAATREGVRDALEATIERLVDGDVLFVSFAGHMTTLAGVGDDPDGWDEAWCLRDGILLDDEFHDLLSDVPAGADVLVVTDSCFAAGMTDGRQQTLHLGALSARVASTRPRVEAAGPTSAVAPAPAPASPLHAATFAVAGQKIKARHPETRLGDLQIGQLVRQGAIPRGESRPASQRREISARVVALAAAAEGSLAFEGENHGLFTAALLQAVDDLGAPEFNYGTLMAAIAERLPLQRPTLGVFGTADSSVVEARAFGAATTGPAPRATHPGPSKSSLGIFGATGHH